MQKIGTDVFTDYTFDTTKYKLLVITFFETSIVNSYVTVVIPSIIGLQQASAVICGPSAGENYVYNVVVKFQVKADGIGWAFAKFNLSSEPTIKRDLTISALESIVGIKKF